ncbi:hypothetical protein OIU78_000607 [Salix suchowensis]|nr:hypothetical protein OIU78_000607 [Salix suchowensis]
MIEDYMITSINSWKHSSELANGLLYTYVLGNNFLVAHCARIFMKFVVALTPNLIISIFQDV